MKSHNSELFIFSVENMDATARLARMKLALHGLEIEICHGGEVNSYYDGPHKVVGDVNFALTSSPANVNAVDKKRLKDAEVAVGANMDRSANTF
jgi:type I restriction enzyme M protein